VASNVRIAKLSVNASVRGSFGKWFIRKGWILYLFFLPSDLDDLSRFS